MICYPYDQFFNLHFFNYLKPQTLKPNKSIFTKTFSLTFFRIVSIPELNKGYGMVNVLIILSSHDQLDTLH